MTAISITKDNVKRFQKRLHKALNNKELLGGTNEGISLSQSGEILARALGCADFHSLQRLLETAEGVSGQKMTDQHFEQDWVDDIEGRVRDYFKPTKNTMIAEITWAVLGGSPCLNILLFEDELKHDKAGFGLYFAETAQQIPHSSPDAIKRELEGFPLITKADHDFMMGLAERMPKSVREHVLLSLFIKENRCGDEESFLLGASDAGRSLLKAMELLSFANFSDEPFVVVPKKLFEETSFEMVQKTTNLAVVPEKFQLEKKERYRSVHDALKKMTPNDVLLVSGRAKQTDCFMAFLMKNDKGAALAFYVGDKERPFHVTGDDDLAELFGSAARAHSLTKQHNPYSVNEAGRARWISGFHKARKDQEPERIRFGQGK